MSFTSQRETTVNTMTSLSLPAASAPHAVTGLSTREHVQHTANLLWFATALGLTTSADAFNTSAPLPVEHAGLTLIMALLLVPGWLRLSSAAAWQRVTVAITYAVVWWHYVGLMDSTSALVSVSAVIAACAFAAPIATKSKAISKVSIASIVCLTLLPLVF